MTLKTKQILFIAIVILLASCSTNKMFTSIDVLRPAETTFPISVNNILVVDNSVVQAYNLGHYDYNTFYDFETPKTTSLEFDSAALFCAAGLTEGLEESYFFNSIKLNPKRLNKTNNFYNINYLSPKLVDSLCNEYNVDALLSLDKILITDYLTYPGHNIYGAFEVNIKTEWSIYYQHTEKREALSFEDDFSWEDDMAKRLPKRYDALVDASILTGRNIAARLIPRWEKQDRYLFAPNKPDWMAEGMKQFTMREWDKAIEAWIEAEQTKSDKRKYQAFNNIAIAYEMQEDYESALIYLTRAFKHYQEIISFSTSEFEMNNLAIYWNFLKKREEELKLIEKQLGK